jgi:MFS family permease
LWAGVTISTTGNQMTAVVAVPVQVYELTHSALDLGLIGLVTFLPIVLFGLFGGAVADAMDRRRLAIATSCALSACSIGLVVQAATNLRLVWVLYLLVGLQAGFSTVDSPARAAIIPRLIPREQLAAANALQQIGFNLGVTVGPLVAGVLIKEVGLFAAYLADAVSFLAALYAVWRLPAVPPEAGGRPPGLRSVAEGLRFVARQPVLLASFLVDIDAMLFGWFRAELPLVAAAFYHGGAGTVALLNWAYAMGAVVVAVLGGWLGRARRQGLGVIVSVAVFGTAITGFALARELWLGLLLLATAGGADMVSAVFRNTILQVVTPDALRGRLSGVYYLVVTGGPRLGDLRGGFVAAASSVGVSVLSGGIALLALLAALAVAVPGLRRYRADRPAGAPVGDAGGVTPPAPAQPP